MFKVALELNFCVVRVSACVLKRKKKHKHDTFSLLLLDKRCMTSVMKVCGIILLHYSPYTWMTCMCCNLCAFKHTQTTRGWDHSGSNEGGRVPVLRCVVMRPRQSCALRG